MKTIILLLMLIVTLPATTQEKDSCQLQLEIQTDSTELYKDAYYKMEKRAKTYWTFAWIEAGVIVMFAGYTWLF